MKKIFVLTALSAVLALAGCNKDFLETQPTDKGASEQIFEDSESALTAINGLYRLMYTGGWGDAWEAENGGLPAYILVFDLYAEDHLMDQSGSGWFYYDYAYDTWSDYTHKHGHSYNIWNFFYTLICNTNYIIAQEEALKGDEDMKNYVMGQAYAIRSMSYWWLANSFCFNGGDASDARRTSVAGVPVYTEPTVAGSAGKGRGTIQETYDQINNDIDKAISYLEAYSGNQLHKSHIDKYVAYGLKARAAMTQRDYTAALAAAEKAMEGASVADFTSGAPAINDVSAKNVLWGLAIQTDQAIGSWDIMDHMDADCKSTYSVARHLIGNWLYDEIPEGDGRLTWWTAPLPEEEWGVAGTANGSKASYVQKKIVYINPTAMTGDHVLMRAEEMCLTAAEAACHLGQFAKARDYVEAVGEKRVAGYADRLAKYPDSKSITPTTSGVLSLMDEILLQRRIELWGEYPRMFDLQRLDLGFRRDWPESNHTEDLTASKFNTEAGSQQFILHLPDSEFDANKALDRDTDQNPAFR